MDIFIRKNQNNVFKRQHACQTITLYSTKKHVLVWTNYVNLHNSFPKMTKFASHALLTV